MTSLSSFHSILNMDAQPILPKLRSSNHVSSRQTITTQTNQPKDKNNRTTQTHNFDNPPSPNKMSN